MTIKPQYIPWAGCIVLLLVILIGGARLTRQKEREIEARIRAELRADSLFKEGEFHKDEALVKNSQFLKMREAYERVLQNRPTTQEHHNASRRTVASASLHQLDSIVFSPVED